MPLITEMDALHDLLVGCAGAMAPEQFDLNMIERVDIGGAKFGKGVALRVTGTAPLPLSDPSTQRSMNGHRLGF
jgi:hypothetical protein